MKTRPRAPGNGIDAKGPSGRATSVAGPDAERRLARVRGRAIIDVPKSGDDGARAGVKEGADQSAESFAGRHASDAGAAGDRMGAKQGDLFHAQNAIWNQALALGVVFVHKAVQSEWR